MHDTHQRLSVLRKTRPVTMHLEELCHGSFVALGGIEHARYVRDAWMNAFNVVMSGRLEDKDL